MVKEKWRGRSQRLQARGRCTPQNIPTDPISLIRMVLAESGGSAEQVADDRVVAELPDSVASPRYGRLLITVERVDLEEEIREGCRRLGLPIPDDLRTSEEEE